MSTDQNHPTVVIGAGLGGLCCGALLARHGVPVTIVEQHNKPGGYATSFERGDGRFVFDVSLHGTSINNNGAARILDDLGVLDRIELVELPEVYRLKTPDLDISVPQRDPEAYIGAIYGFEQSMNNAYMTRIQNETPVNGLHLAGAWGNPGGGFGGALRGGQAAFTALTESWAQE